MRLLGGVRGRLALAGAGLVLGQVAEARAGQECAPSTVQSGVDVSSDQGTIDWSTAAGAGTVFAYAKASQGTYLTDSSFAANWSGMKAAGVIRGAYHFLDPTEGGVEQATYFLNVMGSLDAGDLPPMLDIECPDGDANCLGPGYSGDASGSAILTILDDWLTTVETATGRIPVIYTFLDYFPGAGIDTSALGGYPLWIADYSGTNCFSLPSPWTSAPLWQYASTGTVAGIGEVDQDRFLGTLADLTAFTGGASPGTDGGGSTTAYTAPAQVNGNDAFSLVNWPDGHIELYATATSQTAVRVDTSLAGAAPHDTWSSPVPLTGEASCDVASAFWAAGSGHTTEVFAGLPDGTTESLEYVMASGTWTAFAAFGGVGLSHLSTVAYPDSHIEVFALGDDGAVWHNVSTQSSWGGWSSLGAPSTSGVTFATGAGPILWNDGHAEIFATDSRGGAWHNATNTASPPAWGGWKAIGGGALASRPIPARWADGHVEVFARGTDGHLYVSDSSGGTFPDFAVLNPTQTILGEPSVLVYASYGPEVFARDADSDVVHMWNSSGTWSAWANDFGQVVASDPIAWMRPDGLAEVFGVDASGNVVKSLHDGSTWSAWTTIATGVDACLGGTMLVDAGTPGATKDAGSDGKDGAVERADGAVGAGGATAGGDAAIAGADGGGHATRPRDGGGDARPRVTTGSPADGGDEDASTGAAASAGCSCRVGTATGSPDSEVGLAAAALGLAVALRRKRRAPSVVR